MSGSAREGFLRLEGLVRRFDGHAGVDGLSLALGRGEVLALLGPSGSGKTTTLRLLAGFETPDRGRVLVDGVDVTPLAPARRRIGMVFQHYALFPHLDVGGNVAFGLESQGVAGDELRRRVRDALARVDLAGYEPRQVNQLSGGQQQRVALARALAPEPSILLLDEPLSNLDPALRERTRRELGELIRRTGITTVLVTHEQDEAFELGDRVALLRAGRLEQLGTPEALYAAPASPFVAGFIGRASRLSCVVERGATGVVRVRVAGALWTLPPGATGTDRPAGAAALWVRPEAVRLAAPAEGGAPGRITACRFTGATSLYAVTLATGDAVEVAGPPGAAGVGDPVSVLPSRRGQGGLHLFAAEAS